MSDSLQEPAPAEDAPGPGWFAATFGFEEGNGKPLGSDEAWVETRTRLKKDTKGSGADVTIRGMKVGEWRFSTVAELRQEAIAALPKSGLRDSPLRVSNCGGDPVGSGDVGKWLRTPACDGALFQVASQFNCLEMADPGVVPEDGIADYYYDMTQGPACVLQCAAATAWRNYLIPLPAGEGPAGEGQTRSRQLDGLADVGKALGNKQHRLWRLRNGYVSSTVQGLKEVSAAVSKDPDRLRDLVRVGAHFGADVTSVPAPRHTVAQVLCSAISLGEEHAEPNDTAAWAPLARLVLEACYEATVWAAVLWAARRRAQGKGAGPVFLTQVGGGAFGNSDQWIANAARRALLLAQKHGAGLDVRILHYDLAHGSHGQRLMEQHYAPVHAAVCPLPGGHRLSRLADGIRTAAAAREAVKLLSDRFDLDVVMPAL